MCINGEIRSVAMCLIIALNVIHSFAQIPQNILDSIATDFSGNKAQEQIYLQTNKGIYETGEGLWFKAYVLDAVDLTPSDISQTLYVQLINSETKISVWQGKYFIDDGMTNGNLTISNALEEGCYYLVANTKHSFSADSTFKTKRRLEVVKSLESEVFKSLNKATHKDTTLKFDLHAEGGILLDGVVSEVAFTANNNQGFPTKVSGVLFENNDTLLTLNTQHLGMGSFRFEPHSEKDYYIQLSPPYDRKKYTLPNIKPQGLSLQYVKQDSAFLYFNVHQKGSRTKKKFYLRGQSRGVVYSMVTAYVARKGVIKVPLEFFPQQGIAEFTLFVEDLDAWSTRLVYIKPEKKLNVDITLDEQDEYATRETVKMNIVVKDDLGQPISANLSISVFDHIYALSDESETILSHTHLTSQLRGNVYNAGSYFDDDNDDRISSLDLLMMSQKRENYIWTDATLAQKNEQYTLCLSDSIACHVYASYFKKKAPLDNQMVMVFNSAINNDMDMLLTNELGQFFLTPYHLNLWRGDNVYMKVIGDEKYDYRIKIEDPFDTISSILKDKVITNLPLALKEEELKKEREFMPDPNVIALQEYTVEAKKKTQHREKYLAHLDSMARIDFDDVWVCEHGHLHNYKDGYSHLCECPDSLRTKPVEGEMYRIILYERIKNQLGAYTHYVVDVQDVKFYYPKYTDEELLALYKLTQIKAYGAQRSFDNAKPDDELMKDYRNALYWNPYVKTDEDGIATIEFYCSDIYSQFEIVIEGMDNTGLLGHEKLSFEVLKKMH